MVVFSVSLARLVYDMVHKETNPVLSLVSAWFVFSVGLMDAIVYVSDTKCTLRHMSDGFGHRAWQSFWSSEEFEGRCLIGCEHAISLRP